MLRLQFLLEFLEYFKTKLMRLSVYGLFSITFYSFFNVNISKRVVILEQLFCSVLPCNKYVTFSSFISLMEGLTIIWKCSGLSTYCLIWNCGYLVCKQQKRLGWNLKLLFSESFSPPHCNVQFGSLFLSTFSRATQWPCPSECNNANAEPAMNYLKDIDSG